MDEAARPWKLLEAKFKLAKPLKGLELKRMMDDVSQAIQHHHGEKASLMVVEELSCKLRRDEFGSQMGKRKFFKWLMPRQLIFDFDAVNGSIEGHFSVDGNGNAVVDLDSEAVIARFPFGNELIPLAEIAWRCKLTTKWQNHEATLLGCPMS